MSHVVKMMSKAEILKLQQDLSKHIVPKAPAGSVFTAKTPGCTITAYQSGKVLFQGKDAIHTADLYGGKEAVKKSSVASAAKKHSFSPPASIGKLALIGSDEVGTGDYFGPITVAAAYVAPSQFSLLQELGVKDSKHLNDKQIISIAKDLIHAIPYSLLVLHNEKYNELQLKGMSQGKMKAILHNHAIGKLMKKLNGAPLDGILIDQFCEPDIYFRHIERESHPIKEGLYFATKAESIHLSVAAASILARYSFLKEMDKLSIQIGSPLPKGAGAHVDVKAAELIESMGESVLNKIAKTHFANTQKARVLLSKKSAH